MVVHWQIGATRPGARKPACASACFVAVFSFHGIALGVKILRIHARMRDKAHSAPQILFSCDNNPAASDQYLAAGVDAACCWALECVISSRLANSGFSVCSHWLMRWLCAQHGTVGNWTDLDLSLQAPWGAPL